MTTGSQDGRHREVSERCASSIDELLGCPFARHAYKERERFGGPDHHFLRLAQSHDFWEDRSEEIVDAAEAEIQALHDAVAAAFSSRSGEPATVELGPYIDGSLDEDSAPEPINYLSMVAGAVLVWRPPDSGRWIGLATCQADPEYPIELIAAIGTLENLISVS